MSRKVFLAVLLAAALFIPAAVSAHEGHVHKAMGTVQSISGPHVTVKTTEGKTVTVMLDAKTKITQGKTVLQATALKVGDRIVAEGIEHDEMIMAATVKVGDQVATTAKK